MIKAIKYKQLEIILAHVRMVAGELGELLLELEIQGSGGSVTTPKKLHIKSCPCSISFLLTEMCLYVCKLRKENFGRLDLRKKKNKP